MDIGNLIEEKLKVALSPLFSKMEAFMNANKPATEEGDKHPVLVAALAAGIDTADKFTTLTADAKAGQSYRTDLQEQLKKAAIRLHGPENGVRFAKSYEHLGIEDKKAITTSFTDEADKKFGNGKDGAPATRETKPPKEKNHSADVDNAGDGKAWDQLSDLQKKMAQNLGLKDDAAREEYANRILAAQEKK